MSLLNKKAEMAFALLERVLSVTPVRLRRDLPTILFDVAGTVWAFDSSRQGPLFLPEDRSDAALRVTCSTRALLGMFAPTPMVPDPGEMDLVGNAAALTLVLDCLRAYYAAQVGTHWTQAAPGPRSWRNAS